MRRRLRFFLFFLFTCAISVCCALAQASADRLITEALKPSPLETNLHQLTDEIGGRIPGTPAMQKAVDWGVEAFKAAGADKAAGRFHPSSFVGGDYVPKFPLLHRMASNRPRSSGYGLYRWRGLRLCRPIAMSESSM